MKFKLVFFTLILFCTSSSALALVTSSSNYSIEINSLNSGGDLSNSSSYYLEDTSGEIDSGDQESDDFGTVAGYQQCFQVAAAASSNGIPGFYQPASNPVTTPATPAVPEEPDEEVESGIVGDPIQISNLKIFVVDEVVTISWETNKPTNANIVLEEGVGGVEGGYLDELFTPYHSIQLEDLNLEEDIFFKIFSEGVFGDNNYKDAPLYTINRIASGGEIDGSQSDGGSTGDIQTPGGNYVVEEVKDLPEGISEIIPPVDDKVFSDLGCWYWCLPVVILIVILLLIFVWKRLRGF
ncbi:MAG: hypothetical protein U9P50_01555 [Patescibacteria group bacterium]|nr:hypothetical protein [Patescibacteria group bacterium]